LSDSTRQFDIHKLKEAVLESAQLIKDLRKEIEVFSKDQNVDLVTSADFQSEKILMDAIKSNFPDDGIISEESEIHNPNSERFWIIDPLDGTVNYANNIDQVAITLMLFEDKEPKQAYVYDIYNEILYEGYKNFGAFKNGKQLKVSKSISLDKSIIATGFPYDRNQFSSDYIPTFEAVLKNTGGIRRYGSAALDVCWIADNKFDGYFEFFMKPWDTLGACLILDEAGGVAVDQTQNFPNLDSKLVIASNKIIHKQFQKLVFENLTETIKPRIFENEVY
jgi:myo-inositol-1(or 4)-monophosphatase